MDILHPTDFSATADKARRLAVALHERLGGKLHLVHVQRSFERVRGYSIGLDSVNPELQRRVEEARHEEAEGLRRRLASLAEGGASWELRWGEPLPELLAASEGGDLVVMGAHGPNRFDAAFLGGVAGRLVRRARGPVITVRDEAEAGELAAPSRVLVATDFGAASRAAWEFAGRLGAKRVAAHVIERSGDAEDAVRTSGLESRLRDFAGGEAERLLLREGDPAQLLPRLAREVGADLIAVGLVRSGGLLRLGSRADALLRGSPVPVLNVPA